MESQNMTKRFDAKSDEENPDEQYPIKKLKVCGVVPQLVC